MDLVAEKNKMSVDEVLDIFKDMFKKLPEKYSPLLARDVHENIMLFERIIPLSSFKKEYGAGLIQNFVYYQKTKTVFVDLEECYHTRFMATLHSLHSLEKGKQPTFDDDSLPYMFSSSGYYGQEQFLIEGLGMFQSSCGPLMIRRHRNFCMDAQERMAFGGFEMCVFDW